MSRTLAAIKEWINPNWGTHVSIPPMERGLRPNSLLDTAGVLLDPGAFEPDDLFVPGTGGIWFSSGTGVHELKDGAVRTVSELGGRVGALVRHGTDLVVSVEGRGLMRVDESGAVDELSTDDAVSTCVTDLTTLPDGTLLASVGSTEYGVDGWALALVHRDRTGRLVRISGERAEVVADKLAWPSGIASDDEGNVLVALSLRHRLESRKANSLGRVERVMLGNLPLYPGRICHTDNGWWIAAPYVRNRITALLLDEAALLGEMVSTINQDQWFIPRLRSDNPYTDPLQMGQLRTLGVVKPWAPPRSYGLVFRIAHDGRIAESAHSRVDGTCHGITGVVADGDRVIVAAQGFRSLLVIEEG